MSIKSRDPSPFPSLMEVLSALIIHRNVIKCFSTLTVTVFSPNTIKPALSVTF